MEFLINTSIVLYQVACFHIFLNILMNILVKKRTKSRQIGGMLDVLQAGLIVVTAVWNSLWGQYVLRCVGSGFRLILPVMESFLRKWFMDLFLDGAFSVMLVSFPERSRFAGYLTVSFGMIILMAAMSGWLWYITRQRRRWNQIQVYHEIRADYEAQKRILHDYKNQIGCIQGLLREGNYQEAGTYADKLADIFPDRSEGVDVHNPVINVVLNQKCHLAEMKDISILFHANDLSDLWLEEQDIVSLLSNLLDNAIEACEKMKKDRVIQIRLIRERREFVLSVRNPVSEPVSIENGRISTGKRDKRQHGIGLENVHRILEKYGGMGMMRYEEGYFYYTAVIPEPEY